VQYIVQEHSVSLNHMLVYCHTF